MRIGEGGGRVKISFFIGTAGRRSILVKEKIYFSNSTYQVNIRAEVLGK
jgi:hypothetical protein